MAFRAAALILLGSVLVLLFAPAGMGPFSAVHGPVTALRADRAARVFFFTLESAARQLWPAGTIALDGARLLLDVRASVLQSVSPSDAISAMRC